MPGRGVGVQTDAARQYASIVYAAIKLVNTTLDCVMRDQLPSGLVAAFQNRLCQLTSPPKSTLDPRP